MDKKMAMRNPNTSQGNRFNEKRNSLLEASTEYNPNMQPDSRADHQRKKEKHSIMNKSEIIQCSKKDNDSIQVQEDNMDEKTKKKVKYTPIDADGDYEENPVMRMPFYDQSPTNIQEVVADRNKHFSSIDRTNIDVKMRDMPTQPNVLFDPKTFDYTHVNGKDFKDRYYTGPIKHASSQGFSGFLGTQKKMYNKKWDTMIKIGYENF